MACERHWIGVISNKRFNKTINVTSDHFPNSNLKILGKNYPMYRRHFEAGLLPFGVSTHPLDFSSESHGSAHLSHLEADPFPNSPASATQINPFIPASPTNTSVFRISHNFLLSLGFIFLDFLP